MATARWTDTKTKNIDDAVALLLDKVEDDEPSYGLSRAGWITEKVLERNNKINLLGVEYQYNIIKFSYNKVTTYGTESDKVPQNGLIVVYSNGATVNYIIDKPSDAQTVLRKLLSYSGRNEINDNCLKLESDFFIWLISKVYSGNVDIDIADDQESECELRSIKGFRGDTEDLQTKVTASGESVMNIISTMSFVLESKKLNQISLEIKYKNHDKVELVMKNGALKVEDKSYQGFFEDDDKLDKIAKLYLLSYIEIVPVLKQAYATDIENERWNDKCYVEFLNSVSEDIQAKIQDKTKAINDKLNKE